MKIYTFEERLLTPEEREARRLKLQKDEEDVEFYRNIKEEDFVIGEDLLISEE